MQSATRSNKQLDAPIRDDGAHDAHYQHQRDPKDHSQKRRTGFV